MKKIGGGPSGFRLKVLFKFSNFRKFDDSPEVNPTRTNKPYHLPCPSRPSTSITILKKTATEKHKNEIKLHTNTL